VAAITFMVKNGDNGDLFTKEASWTIDNWFYFIIIARILLITRALRRFEA